MSDMKPDAPAAQAPSKMRVVGPPEKPVEIVKGRLDKLEAAILELDQNVTTFGTTLSDELDDAFNDVWATLQVMLMVQGALVESVQALAAEPGQPHSAANKAKGIIDEAMEAAYGDSGKGSADDGVVPEAEGNPPGDS